MEKDKATNSKEEQEKQALKQKLAMLEKLQIHQIELEMQNVELRRAQKELQELHDKYFDIYEFAPIGYCVLDKNGLILEMNLSCATMLGKERRLLLQSPFFLYVAKKNRSNFFLYHKKIIKTNQRHRCEMELVSPSGTQLFVLLDGMIIKKELLQISITIIGISKLEIQATKSIPIPRFPGQYFYAVIKMVNDAIVTFNSLLIITSWNQAAETLFGYSADEVCGKPLTAVICFIGDKEISLNDIEEGKCITEVFETTGFSKNEGTFPIKLTLIKGEMDSEVFFAGIISKSVFHMKTSGVSGIIGNHSSMHKIFNLIHLLQNSDASVLIQGESGTGKELIAQALHKGSRRAQKPFIAINCGALPPGTLESELFGHVRGAFTGADKHRKGYFQMADTGTIFLDEVGELSSTAQVQLLRVLEEGTFLRLGDDKITNIDVRVISATNKSLKKEVDGEKFRRDLYYRLCVFPINLPSLKERRSDIPALIDHFLKSSSSRQGQNILLSPQALSALMEYQWPGNVRELQNSIQYALITCPGNIIEPVHLPLDIFLVSDKSRLKKRPKRKLNIFEVKKVLQVTNGNKTEAALVLGVARATLYRFLSNITLNE